MSGTATSSNLPLHRLGARAAATAIAQGTLRCETLVRALLDHIATREPVVKAWAFIDPQAALAAARALDQQTPHGVLFGLPIGWKDVIDCAGLPTGCGSPIHAGLLPRVDAAAVAMTRRAGAMVLGKTVTTEFAGAFAGVTTHPLNPLHTPGGSSSGSAAAVADGMVPLAVGTQTGGSTIRPASFCGVVGFKPGFGLISRFGVKQSAESFDTVGTFARSVDDTAMLVAGLTGRDDFLSVQATRPARVTLWKSPEWHEAEPPMVAAIESTLQLLARQGVTVTEASIPAGFTELTEAHHTIEYFEMARALQHEYREHRDQLSALIVGRIETGLACPAAEYEAALALVERCRQTMVGQVLAATDVLLTPAANGEAPEGLKTTGKATFHRAWTALGLPAITLPGFTGPKGLPMGLQLIGQPRGDAALLAHAAWLEEQLARRG